MNRTIKKLYRKGKSDKEIAYVLGVTPDCIRKHRKDLGLPTRSRFVDHERMQEMFQEGRSVTEVAAATGRSVTTVKRYRADLARRGKVTIRGYVPVCKRSKYEDDEVVPFTPPADRLTLALRNVAEKLDRPVEWVKAHWLPNQPGFIAEYRL